jgi:hypothetical protein
VRGDSLSPAFYPIGRPVLRYPSARSSIGEKSAHSRYRAPHFHIGHPLGKYLVSVLSSSSLSGACSASRSLGPIATVKQFPTIAQTRKYDFAHSIASDAISSLMIRRPRMPVASRDWARRSGMEVGASPSKKGLYEVNQHRRSCSGGKLASAQARSPSSSGYSPSAQTLLSRSQSLSSTLSSKPIMHLLTRPSWHGHLVKFRRRCSGCPVPGT